MCQSLIAKKYIEFFAESSTSAIKIMVVLDFGCATIFYSFNYKTIFLMENILATMVECTVTDNDIIVVILKLLALTFLMPSQQHSLMQYSMNFRRSCWMRHLVIKIFVSLTTSRSIIFVQSIRKIHMVSRLVQC